jgi:hypothetical protein
LTHHEAYPRLLDLDFSHGELAGEEGKEPWSKRDSATGDQRRGRPVRVAFGFDAEILQLNGERPEADFQLRLHLDVQGLKYLPYLVQNATLHEVHV